MPDEGPYQSNKSKEFVPSKTLSNLTQLLRPDTCIKSARLANKRCKGSKSPAYLKPTTKNATMNSAMLTPSTAGPRSAFEPAFKVCQFVWGKLAPQYVRLISDSVGEAAVTVVGLLAAFKVGSEMLDDFDAG